MDVWQRLDSLLDAALDWIASDPDPLTRAELLELVDSGDVDELAERMARTLQFGTAGLRGVVAAGSNRMNRAVVIRATRGLADYLLAAEGGGTVVVGRDARPSSGIFMDDTVAVLASACLSVRYFEEPVPTPLVAYAAMELEAQAAVVITASHNPPADNGYKVYAGNGAQIVPPVDVAIVAAIDRVGPAVDVGRISGSGKSERVRPIGDGIFARYLADLDRSRAAPATTPPLRIAYTPLHGVGGKYVIGALAHAGYGDVHPVAAQFEPDGTFPTVSFPNPEEPGALDLVTDLARRVDADIIIANDPDTDRLAVSLPSPNGWSALTGNQIGVLLADHVLEHSRVERPIVVSSIVSSPMLAAIAHHHGARYAQTLTGFKWIWNAALDLEQEGGTFVFGYEEALGYSVGAAVRDKDGISSAVAFADLAAAASNEGMSVRERLDELYRVHGLWVSNQVGVVRPGTEGAAEIRKAMARLASSPPVELAGTPITGVVDYARGAELRPRYLGAAKLIELDLGGLGRLLVRPSGTEPKLKIYGDLRADVAHGTDVIQVERDLLRRAQSLARSMVDYLHLG